MQGTLAKHRQRRTNDSTDLLLRGPVRSTTCPATLSGRWFVIIDADVDDERGAPYETSDARLRAQSGVFPRQTLRDRRRRQDAPLAAHRRFFRWRAPGREFGAAPLRGRRNRSPRGTPY